MATRYLWPGYGEIKVVFNCRAKSIRGKKVNGETIITMPDFVTEGQIKQALGQILPKLARVDEVSPFANLEDIVLDHYRFKFDRNNTNYRTIDFIHHSDHAVLSLGTGIDPANIKDAKLISAAMCKIAAFRAGPLLMNRLYELGLKFGLRINGFDISHGHQRLGTCSKSGRITLSYYNFFLPSHLRDYVMCHELAHLTQLNHSKAFHELCDSYLGGQECRLAAELKKYNWPILR